MIKIRIKNADHEIDIRFPISESELFAKLGEIHAVEGRDAAQSALVTEVYWPEEFSMLKDRFAKLLVLKPTVLKESCRTSENQLFVAEGGFGCSPNSRGRKVFGKFLIDGEETHFNREDFFGIIKNECIPEWAAEKLAELEPSSDEDESEGITMGGM